MFAFSSLWHGEKIQNSEYFTPFWERNIFHFEWSAEHPFNESWLQNTPLRISNVILEPSSDLKINIASESPDLRGKALDQLMSAAARAYAFKSPVLVIWAGSMGNTSLFGDTSRTVPDAVQLENRRAVAAPYLDRICRALFHVAKRYPELCLCLRAARAYHEFPLVDELEWIFDELPNISVAYWHSVAFCRRLQRIGLGDEQEWLERYASRTTGAHLEDVVGDEELFPPGIGEIDFRTLKNDLPGNVIKVMRVHSRFDLHQVWLGYEQLRSYGLV